MAIRSQQIVTNVVLILCAFAAGIGVGVVMYPEFFPAQVVVEDDHDHAHDDHAHDDHAHDDHAAGEGDHLDLTEQAVANLNLEMGEVSVSDYWEKVAFPGEVVEVPGQSDLSVAAPVAGVIEHVAVRDGQSVELGDQLFELRITDPLTTTAQSELLSVLAQLDVNGREIERLRPLASEGLVGKNRKRELEYEVEKLEVLKQTRIQELLARGLPKATVEHVVRTRQLAKRLLITVPNYVQGDRPSGNEITKQVGLNGQPSYSVGDIHTHPGDAIEAGHLLCDLSYHGQLYIQGKAFESDVAAINRMCEQDWGITAEFGHQHHDGHKHSSIRENLKITRIDNHVSKEGVFSFFVPIENEVRQEFHSEGRLYQQWQFRPGQRVHLRLPVEKHEAKICVPTSAVAVTGPNAFVFRKHSGSHAHEHEEVASLVGIGVGIGGIEEDAGHHDHEHEDESHQHDELEAHEHADGDHDHAGHDHAGHDHDDHDHDESAHAFLQLEPVPVHVIHRGHDYIVIEPTGDLHVGDEIAMNAAYKLQLAMQMAAGGGGGHSHDHGHDH